MKGKTAFQKITEKQAMKYADGSMALWLDKIFGHEITTPNAIIDMRERGLDKIVANPNKVKLMTDHVSPPKDTASAIQSKIICLWSGENRIEYLNGGRGGVCHAVIPEKGWVRPGGKYIMSDSHTCTHGAFGAFAAGVGTTELEAAIMTGFWVCPPQKVIRVNFVGKLPANVFAKDLILELIKRIGVKGATNCVLEFGGSVIDEMSMDARMTITNMAVEAGATTGMMKVDQRTINYLWPVLAKNYKDKTHALQYYQRFNSDEDAVYEKIIEIDVTGMVPVTTVGISPENVVSVSSIAGEKTDQVFIGSCTNGRIEDLRIAASIFSQMGGKVPHNISCIIIPATDYVYDRALKEGLIEIFRKANCVVCNSSCGPCLGMSCGVLPPEGKCASTSNRNFEGRMGKGGIVHLVSPATAAVTALNGVISEPSLEMCEQALKDLVLANSSGISDISLTDWEDQPFKKPDYVAIAKGIERTESPNFSGKAFYLPRKNVDTDQIMPAEYLNITNKKELGKHCLESISMSEKDRLEFSKANIIVVDENFGFGSSREHAPWALANAGAGIKCIIAPSFARIFENNMFANGYIAITLSKEIISLLLKEKPEEISINWENGMVEWNDGNKAEFEISEYRKDLIRSGGLVGVMLKLAAELQKEGKV